MVTRLLAAFGVVQAAVVVVQPALAGHGDLSRISDDLRETVQLLAELGDSAFVGLLLSGSKFESLGQSRSMRSSKFIGFHR